MYYLDDSATTKPLPEVVKEINNYFTDLWYNPSSSYFYGQTVAHRLDTVRENILDFIHGDSKDKIIFTSGASESNSLALDGFMKKYRDNYVRPKIVYSCIEHSSIINLAKSYNNSEAISVNKKGFLDITNLLETLISDKAEGIEHIIVSVQMANNEIGTIQNIKHIAKIVHTYGCVLHVDATQAFGKISIDVKDLEIDMLSASGHKIFTPKGIGILYIKDGIEIEPIIYGNQQYGLRGGTENVPYIIGLNQAIKEIQFSTNSAHDCFEIQKAEREYCVSFLKSLLPNCKINGSEYCCLPNIISLTYEENVSADALIQALDIDNILLSSGSACNSHENKPSHVLKAIGLSDEESSRTIRITLPSMMTGAVKCRIDTETKAIQKIVDTLKRLAYIEELEKEGENLDEDIGHEEK